MARPVQRPVVLGVLNSLAFRHERARPVVALTAAPTREISRDTDRFHAYRRPGVGLSEDPSGNSDTAETELEPGGRTSSPAGLVLPRAAEAVRDYFLQR